ncbi:hypothetical protein K227x_29760 [Rubripirellula lacrimiformis]|uniref:DUF1853 domain-containing protein n=1 Tax=Rubripirellula lacrimiformis TaxID=1930273 RepID=A0A517NBR8_9BACT|nr:DUF1853 family protein [Rubripirellula lacrimiformis]QDT04584.1 hypothetical protein K227x_29760 [Rubripirellula lacrimiformis]
MTVLNEPDQWVRDLLWVIRSPSLIGPAPPKTPNEAAKTDMLPSAPDGSLANAFGADGASFNFHQIDHDQLAAYFADQVPRRVGFYFERLVQFWLTHIRGVEMVASSLQVREGQRTLGEIDFLFRDELGRLTHWEVAVKFYLHVPHTKIAGSHFVGPHLKDTFQRKRDRIFDHQLPLGRSHFPEIEIQQTIVKGRIFYALDHPPVQQLPPAMSPGHLRERWLRRADLAAIERQSDSRYQILTKPYWLSDANVHETNPSAIDGRQLNDQISQRFSSSDHPVLVSRLSAESDRWIEAERWFVVPDDWPNVVNAS